METENTQQQEVVQNEVKKEYQRERPVVSFDDISLSNIVFNEEFRPTRGTASQLICGFQSMANRTGEGSNEFQKLLYPKLKQMSCEIVDNYVDQLLTANEGVQRQVFGAILNGSGNDGNLHYQVTTKGVKREVVYKYSQFGDLLRLLCQRLEFIVNRSADSVQRYRENESERREYKVLQEHVKEFLGYLETVKMKWREIIEETRKVTGTQKGMYRNQQKQVSERTQRNSDSYGRKYQDYNRGNSRPIYQKEDGWQEVGNRHYPSRYSKGGNRFTSTNSRYRNDDGRSTRATYGDYSEQRTSYGNRQTGYSSRGRGGSFTRGRQQYSSYGRY
uniref:Uncharacterized protein n=1 Tax=viral metagenome TaxID=1070528 RepID=A0A6C0EC49_9ZZZZ